MTLIDSGDKLSVKTLLHLYKQNVIFCYDTDSLNDIFETFRKGSTHLAFVIELVQNENSDPYEICVGIVTMHDIIEALLQLELSDEMLCASKSLTFGINYLKKLIDSQKRNVGSKSSESFGCLGTQTSAIISAQTKFVLSQILNSNQYQNNSMVLLKISSIKCFYSTKDIKPFRQEFIEKSILEKIIMNEQNYVHKYMHSLVVSGPESSLYLYKYQQPSDYFILLLGGSFLVEAGAEKTELLTKQYDHFGEKALLGERKSFF